MVGREESVPSHQRLKGQRPGKGSFLARQFAVESTRAQRIFDWIGGVVIFTLLTQLSSAGSDRNFLEECDLGRILFGRLDAHVLLFSFAALAGLVCLLLKREINPGLLIPLAATQFVGAVLCLIVALLSTPLALVLLASAFIAQIHHFSGEGNAASLAPFLYTFLLLLPWLPFFCFLRNGVRGVRRSSVRYGPILPAAVTVFILAVLLAVTWPYLGKIPPWERIIDSWPDFDLL